MSPLTRGWLGFAAVGAGLIHLALVIGSPAPSAVICAVIGLAELVWGLYAMGATTLAAPRATMAGALVPGVLWVLGIVASAALSMPQMASSLRVLPLLVATSLEFFVAAALAVQLRRRVATASPGTGTGTGTGRYLLGLAVGALIVGAVTTPALAATAAGEYAVPHGTFDHGPAH